jgi:hypothetical protein
LRRIAADEFGSRRRAHRSRPRLCAGQDLAEAAPKDGAMPDLWGTSCDSQPGHSSDSTLEKPVLCAVKGVVAVGRSIAFRATSCSRRPRQASFNRSRRSASYLTAAATFILPHRRLHRATVMTMLAEKCPPSRREIGDSCICHRARHAARDCAWEPRQLATMPTRIGAHEARLQ